MEYRSIPKIDITYDEANNDSLAREIGCKAIPTWKTETGEIEITRFTDGIMNTLLKLTKHKPDQSKEEADADSVLLRAYGRDSNLLVDRKTELRVHALLAERGLAAPLVARFNNGLVYRFLPGRVCTPEDLRKERVWRSVADQLGQWHAKLPLVGSGADDDGPNTGASTTSQRSIWTVMNDWVMALPETSAAATEQKLELLKALTAALEKLSQGGYNDESQYVMGHCDLLSANVIIVSDNTKDDTKQSNSTAHTKDTSRSTEVKFIDYEYAVPCPVAFELANHFSEWGGYSCDYGMIPTRATRRKFIEAYCETRSRWSKAGESEFKGTIDGLCREVDEYRGLPGFYWGVQALIQAQISDVKFDWSSYAELRLAEFWAWRQETNGTRGQLREEKPLRECRWDQESD